uniref:mitochondrial inner membrane protease subunit 2 n=1 Tax=Ictidomys tridecemlineatus TaxID=43179 RepID=UPI001A9DAD98|nr:mitochondrial inner membrane protease subunit 2 [Ictidomys tridecemlineatus]
MKLSSCHGSWLPQSSIQGMAQSQGWVKRYLKAFCKGFFVAVPVAVTFLDRVACVARVEGASMQLTVYEPE